MNPEVLKGNSVHREDFGYNFALLGRPDLPEMSWYFSWWGQLKSYWFAKKSRTILSMFGSTLLAEIKLNHSDFQDRWKQLCSGSNNSSSSSSGFKYFVYTWVCEGEKTGSYNQHREWQALALRLIHSQEYIGTNYRNSIFLNSFSVIDVASDGWCLSETHFRDQHYPGQSYVKYWKHVPFSVIEEVSANSAGTFGNTFTDLFFMEYYITFTESCEAQLQTSVRVALWNT